MHFHTVLYSSTACIYITHFCENSVPIINSRL